MPQVQPRTARPRPSALPGRQGRGHLQQRLEAGLGRVAEAPDHADQRAPAEHDERRGPQVPPGRDGQVPRRRGLRPGRRLRAARRVTPPPSPSA
ncbi:hypothetical protein OF001_U160044 [Pseudomonas sp. OF001]|nr:hypothetical protein OF001_U160044 [Pseudomonas sp. OF001]